MLADVCKRSQQVTTCWVSRVDENTKESGTQIPTIPYIPLFGARAQRCWKCCANEHNIVGPRFDDRETAEMLALVGSEV